MPTLQSSPVEKKLKDLSLKLELMERRIARAQHLAQRNEALAAKPRATAKAKRLALAAGYAARLPAIEAKAKRLRTTIRTVKHNLRTAIKMDMLAAEQAAPGVLRTAQAQAKAQQEAVALASLSPREAQRRLREAEHAANRIEKARRTRRQRFIAADVDPDERLATSLRDIDVTGLGRDTRAYVSGLASVLRNKGERLPSRIQAWDKFDATCDAACAGLVGSPKFDVAVQTSHSPDMPASRLEAGQVMTLLSRHIGVDGWGLLFAVIFMRRGFSEIVGDDKGRARQDIAARFRAALDGAAQFWGLTDGVAIGREARRILRYFDEEAGAARHVM